MISRMLQKSFGLFAVALLCGCGSSYSSHVRTQESGANPAHQPVQTTDLNTTSDRDVLLYGQSDGRRDVAFEGKAASSLQQHTFTGEGAEFDPAVDPTGKLLVFASTRHSRHSHLYMKPIDGASLTQLTDGPANDAQPCFSPDGRKLAFTSDRGGQWDVWVIDLDGRHPMQITTNAAPELHPSWSPDGSRLVFCRIQPRGGAGELWIADLANPGVQRLIGEGLFPAWSPAGDKIAYQRARQRGSRWFSIWTITLKDDEPTMPTEVATSSQAALIAPAWSPDGRQIAFACVAPTGERGTRARNAGLSRADIGVVDSDGRGLIRLTEGGGDRYSPCWASNDRIYFTTKLENNETIWSIKPFHFTMPAYPPSVIDNRRAAQASDVDAAP